MGLGLRPEPKCQKRRDRLTHTCAQGSVFAQHTGALHRPSEGQILPWGKGAGLGLGFRYMGIVASCRHLVLEVTHQLLFL